MKQIKCTVPGLVKNEVITALGTVTFNKEKIAIVEDNIAVIFDGQYGFEVSSIDGMSKFKVSEVLKNIEQFKIPSENKLDSEKKIDIPKPSNKRVV